ncbi:MAG: NAD(+) diphosphatase [Alphaproteobacteria bacterium]|nr:NAD(+) diphosphatase [Alphaproteobacteria bacterium]
MTMRRPNIYADFEIDRAGHLRRDDDWLESCLRDAASRLIPVWRTRSLVRTGAEAPESVVLPMDPAIAAEASLVVFLGLIEEVPHFAVDLSVHEQPPMSDHGEFTDLRRVGQFMAPGDGGLLAYARAMMTWHARHRFCSACGGATESKEAGHVRRCANAECGTLCFPRTDPAVIMLVHDGGDRVVLGRKANMLPGQHSILAGFVEPGESLEDAVAREVFEEVGLRITDTVYHSSQPWPFPANIMLGFTARATTFDLTVDYHELEDGARWFTRDELRNSPEDATLRLPRRDSISRRLIDEWLEE